LETNEHSKELQAVNSSELKVADIEPAKKPFVEPEISAPVDVLEATTFLQAIASGQVP
jgi:hypothetical protein